MDDDKSSPVTLLSSANYRLEHLYSSPKLCSQRRLHACCVHIDARIGIRYIIKKEEEHCVVWLHESLSS